MFAGSDGARWRRHRIAGRSQMKASRWVQTKAVIATRASHADREQVIDTLKAAFGQGLLTKDELDARAGQAFASRTYAELAAVTAGIPAGPAPAQPLREPAWAQARPPENEAVDSSQNKVVNACAGAAATALALYLAFYAFHAGNFGLLFVVLLAIAGA